MFSLCYRNNNWCLDWSEIEVNINRKILIELARDIEAL